MDRSREESEVESDRGDARGMQALIWARLETMEIGTHEGTFVSRNIASVVRVKMIIRLPGIKPGS